MRAARRQPRRRRRRTAVPRRCHPPSRRRPRGGRGRARRPSASRAVQSAGTPRASTPMMPRVRGVIRSATRVDVHGAGVASYVDEAGGRAAVEDRVPGGRERVVRDQHLVARPDTESGQRQVQARRAVVHRDGMCPAAELGEACFELGPARTLSGEPTRREHLGDGVELAVIRRGARQRDVGSDGSIDATVSRDRGRRRTPGRAGSRSGRRCASRSPSPRAPC